MATATERTRAAILAAAVSMLARRPDAAMADIADHAGVGRATLYRHFPTRDALLRGVTHHTLVELGAALKAAGLDTLPVHRAIAHIAALFVRTGTQYAALFGLGEAYLDPPTEERVIREPVRDVLARGIGDGTLRGDLAPELLFEMFSALIERALTLTGAGTLSPEQATDTVVTVFLDGARGGRERAGTPTTASR